MMDEHLIGEVERHAVIYNRQKSCMFSGDKSANKEMAWAKIAQNLGTDPETCKKRWKYLRERYVQQKKVGESPSYEHLSRPYLEKMRFLDHFIQPRKSYRNVNQMMTSPSHSQHSLIESGPYKDESAIDRRLEQTLQISQIMQQFHNQMLPDSMVQSAMNGGVDHSGQMSSENLSLFEQYNSFHQQQQHHHQFPIPQHQQNSQSHPPHQQHLPTANNTRNTHTVHSNSSPSHLTTNVTSANSSEASVPNADQLQTPTATTENVIKNEINLAAGSSSSSLVSSMASPVTATSQHASETFDENSRLPKRRRSSASIPNRRENTTSGLSISNQIHSTNASNNSHILSDDGDEDDNDSPNISRLRSPPFPSDFLYPFYQHATSHAQHKRQHHQQRQQPIAAPVVQAVRNSEQLLGELVTSELLKMSKERRKVAQKKILEILFFDD